MYSATSTGKFYRVKASYMGGPSEVIKGGLDQDEAIALARDMQRTAGWDAWFEVED